uniref:Uncharacterized protein n=1 Tax=Anguilla anguilla TaxID=7936 RepID=A0A0E9QRS4_ANGAN
MSEIQYIISYKMFYDYQIKCLRSIIQDKTKIVCHAFD